MIRRSPLYTRQFLQVLIGAMLTMIGVSMQFHFGEYVSNRGFSINTLGQITSVGVLGSLFLRPYAGSWIDRLGCRPCFLAGAVGAALANFSYQFVDSLWLIFIIRIVMQTSNATYLATVAVYAAQVAPPHRRAESLGTVGIGGFLGMMVGPGIGDMIFGSGMEPNTKFQLFFSVVAGFSILAGVMVANVRVPSEGTLESQPPVRTLLRRHWPGRLFLVPIIFAAALTLHMVFLERYAEHRGFVNIKWFFLIYAPTAILLRLLFREIPQRYGRRRVCITGLLILGIGIVMFITVRVQWQLVIPAVLYGAGHCFIFPSMVDLIADVFPARHRGVGTSLALGGMDIGFIVGGLAWGQLIESGGFKITFVVVAVLTWMAALTFVRHPRPADAANG